MKSFILIPHLVCLNALGIALGLIQLFVWIPVLLTGHYPAWAFDLTRGTLSWTARVWAYFWGLTDRYPPFSLS